MGYSRLNIGSCGTIFFFCILLELLNGLTVQAKTLPMQWSPLTIEQAIRPGDTLTVTAMLTSKNALHNVDLWIAPELDPLVTVFPNHFDAIRANTTHAVDIHISIPYLSSTGLYEGTIHIKKKCCHISSSTEDKAQHY